jgi:hypothetical protein
MTNFTPDQLTALEYLVRLYPYGAQVDNPRALIVYDSLADRGTDIVERIEGVDGGYRLTDSYAESYQAETERLANEIGAAPNN